MFGSGSAHGLYVNDVLRFGFYDRRGLNFRIADLRD
jgi:hypothetical protein